MNTLKIHEPSDEEIDYFINSLLQHNEAVINSSIEVAGGMDEAIKIIENAPQKANAYNVMYQEYGYLESFFMVDHNLTIKLDDLKQAVSNYQRIKK